MRLADLGHKRRGFLSFLGVDRDSVCLFVLFEQTLVHRAALEVEAGCLKAEEAQVAVDQVSGTVQRFVAVETNQGCFMGIRVVHFEQAS
jgi:hypothetical protein